jgi:MFS family permease
MAGISEERRKWWVVVAMSGVMILLTLDFFGITVALPKIGEDLDASTATLLWTVNAYLLAFVSPMIAIGRLADIFGRRLLALIGIVLFVGASAAAGASPNDLFLIVARVVQGVGGGIIFTTSVSIVSNAFPPDERPRTLGIWSGVGLAGLLCAICVWPALWGRRRPAEVGANPRAAHPLWAALWRRHHA